jgi:hypothetical protein
LHICLGGGFEPIGQSSILISPSQTQHNDHFIAYFNISIFYFWNNARNSESQALPSNRNYANPKLLPDVQGHSANVQIQIYLPPSKISKL